MSQASREWNSEAYHRLSRPQFEWGLKVLERLPLRGDETLADGGCGSGKVSAKLLERLPRGRMLAMDLSLNMLQTAREHLLPKFGDKVQFIVTDLQEIPLASTLDGIFSTAAFHWVPDHDRLFGSLLRALKPGGWLEAQCGGGPNLARVRQRALVLMSRPDYAVFFNGWQPTWQYPDDVTTAKRMSDAGFTAVKVWLEQSPATLANASEYKEFLRTVTLHRHLERITDSAMREGFMDELARPAAADNPPFTLDYWRLNMSGRKPKDQPQRSNDQSNDRITRCPDPLIPRSTLDNPRSHVQCSASRIPEAHRSAAHG
jgi:trans-aconitate methyltransferase